MISVNRTNIFVKSTNCSVGNTNYFVNNTNNVLPEIGKMIIFIENFISELKQQDYGYDSTNSNDKTGDVAEASKHFGRSPETKS